MLKLITLITCCLLTSCHQSSLQSSAAPNTAAPKTESAMQTNQSNEPPFACNMKAMNAEQLKRYHVVAKQLDIAKRERRELPNGYAFRLPSDSETMMALAEWMNYERLCCPFFDFVIELERNGGPLWLKLSGRDGIKPFIQAEFNF